MRSSPARRASEEAKPVYLVSFSQGRLFCCLTTAHDPWSNRGPCADNERNATRSPLPTGTARIWPNHSPTRLRHYCRFCKTTVRGTRTRARGNRPPVIPAGCGNRRRSVKTLGIHLSPDRGLLNAPAGLAMFTFRSWPPDVNAGRSVGSGASGTRDDCRGTTKLVVRVLRTTTRLRSICVLSFSNVLCGTEPLRYAPLNNERRRDARGLSDARTGLVAGTAGSEVVPILSKLSPSDNPGRISAVEIRDGVRFSPVRAESKNRWSQACRPGSARTPLACRCPRATRSFPRSRTGDLCRVPLQLGQFAPSVPSPLIGGRGRNDDSARSTAELTGDCQRSLKRAGLSTVRRPQYVGSQDWASSAKPGLDERARSRRQGHLRLECGGGAERRTLTSADAGARLCVR